MVRSRMWVGGVVGLVCWVATGCGPSESPVAITVGERQLTQQQLEQGFWRAVEGDSTLGHDLASLESYAESKSRDMLLEELIMEHAGTLEPFRQERLMAWYEQEQIDRLHEQEYGDAYEVTDEDLQDAYEKLSRRLKVHHILINTAEEANEIRRVVREGGAFDKIAAQRSLDLETKGAGGLLGWLTYTDVDPLTRDVIFSLDVGEVSPPQTYGNQFQVFYVSDTTENLSRGPLDAVAEELRRGILQRNVINARKAYEKRLYETYDLTMNPVEIAWLTVHMRESTRAVKRGGEAIEGVNLEDGSMLPTEEPPWGDGLPVAPADTARVVATYADREVHPLLVFDQLFTHPMPTWPRFETSADVEELIRELVLEQLEVIECAARGFDQEPEILQAFEEKQAEIRERQFMRTEVRRKLQPTDEEIEEYYQINREQYAQPERRRFVAANVADYDKAAEIAQAMRAGATIAAIAETYSVGDPQFRTTGPGGTPPLVNGDSPLLDSALFSLTLNEISDPIAVPTQDGTTTYTVVKLIEIFPETVTPLDDVDVEIRQAIVESRIPAFMEGLLDDAAHRYPVSIDWDVVRSASLRPNR